MRSLPTLLLHIVLLSALLLSGCTAYLRGGEPCEMRMRVVAVGAEGTDNFFPCRSLFRTGTGIGMAATDFLTDVSTGQPVLLKGKLKSWSEMQAELAVLGFPVTLARYRGKVGGEYVFSADLDIPGSMQPITVERTGGEHLVTGLPGGLPAEISVKMQPGEGMVGAYAASDGRIILLSMELTRAGKYLAARQIQSVN